MSKEDCIVCHYQAYGDTIHMSVIIDELKKKYKHIYMDVNEYGLQLFNHDPRIDKISYFEPWFHFDGMNLGPGIQKHIQKIRDKNPNKDVIDFFGFADYQFFDTEVEPWSFEKRKEIYGRNWHERYFEAAGLEVPNNFTASYPSISFNPTVYDEIEKHWYAPNKDSFNIITPLGGSTRNKGFPQWIDDFGIRIIDALPKAKLFTVGDQHCPSLEWRHERTIHLSHRNDRAHLPMVNAIVMTKYANYVFGAETGILSAAGMYGTPKTTLCTCSSVSQLCKYHKNDYSMQAEIDCSPCHRTCFHGPSRQKEPCPKSEMMIYPFMPLCTERFNLDKLFDLIYGQYIQWEKQQ